MTWTTYSRLKSYKCEWKDNIKQTTLDLRTFKYFIYNNKTRDSAFLHFIILIDSEVTKEAMSLLSYDDLFIINMKRFIIILKNINNYEINQSFEDCLHFIRYTTPVTAGCNVKETYNILSFISDAI